MDFLDTLAAIATGIGQGQAVLYQRQMLEQQRQDALRQQAVENALARQRLEQDAAELAWKQKQFELQQEAKAAEDARQRQIQREAMELALGRPIKVGTKVIGKYQPTVSVPVEPPTISAEEWKGRRLLPGTQPLSLRESFVPPSWQKRLVMGTEMGRPRTEQVPVGPPELIMEPIMKSPPEMTEAELGHYNVLLGTGEFVGGKFREVPYYQRQQRALETAQMQTNLERARLGYAKDVKTFDVAVAQDVATLQDTLMDIEAKKRAAILADPEVKRMLALSAWMEANRESVTTDVVKELRARIEQNSARIAQARVNLDWLMKRGLTPQQFAILHQVDAALSRLSISQGYLGLAQEQAATRGKPTEATIRREWVGLVDDVISKYNKEPAYTSEQAEAAIRKYAKAYGVPETDPYIQSALATIRQPKGSVNPVIDPLGLGITW